MQTNGDEASTGQAHGTGGTSEGLRCRLMLEPGPQGQGWVLTLRSGGEGGKTEGAESAERAGRAEAFVVIEPLLLITGGAYLAGQWDDIRQDEAGVHAQGS